MNTGDSLAVSNPFLLKYIYYRQIYSTCMWLRRKRRRDKCTTDRVYYYLTTCNRIYTTIIVRFFVVVSFPSFFMYENWEFNRRAVTVSLILNVRVWFVDRHHRSSFIYGGHARKISINRMKAMPSIDGVIMNYAAKKYCHSNAACWQPKELLLLLGEWNSPHAFLFSLPQ